MYLVITYFGSYENINNFNIIQQFKYALEPDKIEISEIKGYINDENLNKIKMHYSTYSGLGKTY